MKIFYERYWNERQEMGDEKIKWEAVKSNIPIGKNIRFLDFGCGKGFLLSKILKVNPDLLTTGADISKIAIEYAKKIIPSGKFFVLEDGKELPFKNNYFDFILAADVLEHIYDTELILSEIARILKPGKRIFISVPYHGMLKNIIVTFLGFDSYFDPKQPHIRFYTKKNLFKTVENAGLRVIKHGYYGRFYPVSHGMYVVCEKLPIIRKKN